MFLRLFRKILPAVALACVIPGMAAADLSHKEAFDGRYRDLAVQIDANDYGLPLYIESEETQEKVDGDVYGIIDQPYAAIRKIAESPGAWCDIILLHLNVKSAVHHEQDNRQIITVFTDSKKYKRPEEAFQVDYRYDLVESAADYCLVTLKAPEAPMNTQNHCIEFEALELDDKRTFVHLSYSYEYGSLARAVITGYMNTKGRTKVGFSQDGRGKQGKGIRGAIERNAVRYYLAIKAHTDTLGAPVEKHFARSAGMWFDLAEKYPRQLHEMDREDYLANKEKESCNQVELQISYDRRETAKKLAVDEANRPAVN